MKKTNLLIAFALVSFTSQAQLSLSGTTYHQTFDGLTTSGIPTGWAVYNSATATSLGTLDLTYSNSTTWGSYFDTTGCPTDVFGHGFKNSASNEVSSMCTASCATQQAASNRCLAVRQASNSTYPGFDPGPSFALELANTVGDTGFTVTFQLQSLDANSPRVTTWVLDYGLGASPSSFIPVATTGTMTTGGNTCASHSISAHMPAAINNQSGPVWIRISTLAPSTGSGNRTTSGIDDFALAWNTSSTLGITTVSSEANLTLNVIGAATSDNISLACTTEVTGAYHLSIYDLSGRVLHAENANLQAGANTLFANGLHLAPGMYIARMTNSNSSAVARIMIQ